MGCGGVIVVVVVLLDEIFDICGVLVVNGS